MSAANWSEIIQSNIPRDSLGMTKTQENKISQVVGFAGTNNKSEAKSVHFLFTEETSVNLQTDFGFAPVGTILFTPKIADVFCYVRINKTSNNPASDWRKVTKSAV